MEKILNELVKRLQETYGNDLVSVILYGSAASGDVHEKYSDRNVLCVLRTLGVEELRKAEKTVQWWIGQKNPAPLILSLEEAVNSHDVFPIEFLDMQHNHRLLAGKDVISGIEVNRQNHRCQLEHELRAGLLRLRSRFLAAQQQEKAVIELMARSIATFATLARHALIAAGEKNVPIRKREIFQAAAKRFQLDPLPFETVLQVREGIQTLSGEQAQSLFGAYLEQIKRLVLAVDQL